MRIRQTPRSRVRRTRTIRLDAVPTTADLERVLDWMARELRAEEKFAWYRSRRPHAFVLACPPEPN